MLRVDGGMTASAWTMQAIADQLAAPVDRPAIAETTALGAAYLAGWTAGVCPEPEEFAATWRLERRFTPAAGSDERAVRYQAWREAVASVASGRSEGNFDKPPDPPNIPKILRRTPP